MDTQTKASFQHTVCTIPGGGQGKTDSACAPKRAPVFVPIPGHLLSIYQCPLQLSHSSTCLMSQPAYQAQQQASSGNLLEGESPLCPFGHRAALEEEKTQEGAVSSPAAAATVPELTPLSPFLCLEYLKNECDYETTWSLAGERLFRCRHGFHPLISELPHLTPYHELIRQHYGLPSALEAPNCCFCSKPISFSVCQFGQPSTCTHLFCCSCMSLWQLNTDHFCPRCTNMPSPKKAAQPARRIRTHSRSSLLSGFFSLRKEPKEGKGNSESTSSLSMGSRQSVETCQQDGFSPFHQGGHSITEPSINGQGRTVGGHRIDAEMTLHQWLWFLLILLAAALLLIGFFYVASWGIYFLTKEHPKDK